MLKYYHMTGFLFVGRFACFFRDYKLLVMIHELFHTFGKNMKEGYSINCYGSSGTKP